MGSMLARKLAAISIVMLIALRRSGRTHAHGPAETFDACGLTEIGASTGTTGHPAQEIRSAQARAPPFARRSTSPARRAAPSPPHRFKNSRVAPWCLPLRRNAIRARVSRRRLEQDPGGPLRRRRCLRGRQAKVLRQHVPAYR
jgi:hypothetical protein